MNKLTMKDSIGNWTRQVHTFLEGISTAAKEDDWHTTFSECNVSEEPSGVGASLTYTIPVLELSRALSNGSAQRITFEPRYRFAIGATGRIDVYSHPASREAMLLRSSNVEDPESQTWEELEALIGKAPWRAFSTERLPLDVDFNSKPSVRRFLSDLVA